ncbi:MAG TPA: SlyX family protein [Pontiellaceae bacterium]|nr:SlyX family protein [Pontiellaceae bacterium]HPR83207.1 SlyX family protein [Pontiellaceae bacterium]
MEDRLIKMEMLYSDQSRMLEDLSQEMYQQQVEIKRLTARIKLLEEKTASISESNNIGGHERPPHY